MSIESVYGMCTSADIEQSLKTERVHVVMETAS